METIRAIKVVNSKGNKRQLTELYNLLGISISVEKGIILTKCNSNINTVSLRFKIAKILGVMVSDVSIKDIPKKDLEYDGLNYAKNYKTNKRDIKKAYIDGAKSQNHNNKILLSKFYLWMKENDFDHNIESRVEKKADMFLKEYNAIYDNR